jgi:acyl carrier protein
MTDNVESVVKSVIAEQFAYPESELNRATHLHDDIGVDSMAVVELAARLEDAFLVKFGSFEKLETVGDIMNRVSAELKKTQ